MSLGGFAWTGAITGGAIDRVDQMFERALAQDPPPNVIADYAVVLTYRRDDTARAEELFGRALAADPENVGILLHFANLLAHGGGKHEEAQTLCERALAVADGDPEINATAAAILSHAGEGEGRVRALFEAAVRCRRPAMGPSRLATPASSLRSATTCARSSWPTQR